jgi:hypothetical protein
MAKKFMFVCFGALALAAAYAVGASNSVAQVGGSDVVASYLTSAGQSSSVVTANGDIYARAAVLMDSGGTPVWSNNSSNWTYMGNCFAGSVTNQQNSLGGVKSLFR